MADHREGAHHDAHPGTHPDAHYADERLARVYDAFEGPRDDLDLYMSIAQAVGATSVLDVGCGTGVFALFAQRAGMAAAGIDPAQAMLDVARHKPGGEFVDWFCADSLHPPPVSADFATMTGNVAQVFLTDDAWAATLNALAQRLVPGGHLVFETRRPEARAWEAWARAEPVEHHVPGIGRVRETRTDVVAHPPLVSFAQVYAFPHGEELRSESTLRFRGRDENRAALGAAGFDVLEIRDAPDRPGAEDVYVCQKVIR